jgi:hypothetical protein
MSAKHPKQAQKIVALCLALAVMSIYNKPVLASLEDRRPPAGEITAAGSVLLDGVPTLSGQTFFSGGTFSTGQNSFSVITLNNLGRIKLSDETTLNLSFSDSGITGALSAGRVRIASPAGVLTRLSLSDVELLADLNEPTLFEARIEDDGIIVSVEQGQLKAIRGEDTELIPAGRIFSTGSRSLPQATSQQKLSGAGKIGLALGVAGAITLIAVIVSGSSEVPITPEPCVVILSGGARCPS